MLGFITKYLDARKERQLKGTRLAIELMVVHSGMMGKMAEIHVARSQSKCLNCKHKFEERFAEGGMVAKINRDETVFNEEELKNLGKKLAELNED